MERTPFGQFAGASPGAARAAGGSEALGYALLATPALGTLGNWFWVGSMTQLRDIGPSLNLLVLLVVGVSTVLIVVEASQLGMGKGLDARGKAGTSPVSWLLLSLMLWGFGYPFYLHSRTHYGRRGWGFLGAFLALWFLASCYMTLEHAQVTAGRR